MESNNVDYLVIFVYFMCNLLYYNELPNIGGMKRFLRYFE
jgi:hypothetical protein